MVILLFITLKTLPDALLLLRQNIDSLVIVVSSSSAFMPITELPLLLSLGLHTATE